MSKTKYPLLWIIWHPHQGLWNWKLLGVIRKNMPIAPVSRMICRAIVHSDTLILWMRAFVARVSLLGISKIFHQVHVPDNVSVVYLDLGTHKEASELFMVINNVLPSICNNFHAYGFEANQESIELAKKKFTHSANVQLIHKALVRDLPSNGKIRLYKDAVEGLGDSIYRHSGQYEDVECMRLSDFLTDNRLIEENRIVLLRMNIEGAEYDVIQDLVENGLGDRIDGYFGMWDDVSSIDLARDAEFRALLAKHQIRPFTFNGRDLGSSIRRKCIVYHIHTRIMHKLRRLQQARDNCTNSVIPT